MSVQSKLTPFGAALAGALGACFSNAVVYPLDVAKTRIQATSATVKGKSKHELTMLAVLLDILEREGILGWYRGFAATMINTFSMQYAYFFFYAWLRTSYLKRLAAKTGKTPVLSTAAELSLGAAAGALSQIFTIPVSVIATRQQVGRRDGERTDESFLAVARDIVREDGITGLWLGIKPGMVLTVNPAITYGVYERLRTVLVLAGAVKLTPGLSFLLGAFSKTLATIVSGAFPAVYTLEPGQVTYPYIMAKVRIQARTREDEDELSYATTSRPKKSTGAIGLLIRVLETEGLKGWYQGMSAQIVKAVLSQALLFVSKEQFERWAMTLMVLFAKLR